MTRTVSFGNVVQINPTTQLKIGSISKFVSMDKLDVFNRKINGYEDREFKGGSKFLNCDTLLARITPCLENGKTAYVDVLGQNEVCAGSTEFIVLRAIDKITDPEYVYYLSISPEFRAYAIQAMIGTSGRQRVQVDVLSKFEFELPELQEQKKIACILSSLDQKIELNRKMNETLEQIGQALFMHYFVDNVEAEEWKIGKVSDLTNIYSGYAFKRTDFDFGGKYGLVTIKNVQDGDFISKCTDRLGELPVNIPDYIHLRSGDILLSLTGNVGRVCAIFGNDMLLNQRVAKIEGKTKKLRAFAYFQFRQDEFKEKLISMSRGTAQLNLSPVEVKSIKMAIPPDEVLNEFTNKAEPLFDQIIANYEQIQTLTTLRDTLLPRLMNGKIEL